MIKKVCPFCNSDSYSSYNDPNWLCPYCKKNIGDSSQKEIKQEHKKYSRQDQASGQVLPFKINESWENHYKTAIKD